MHDRGTVQFELAALPPGALRWAWMLVVGLPMLVTVVALAVSSGSAASGRLLAAAPGVQMAIALGLVLVFTVPLAIWLQRSLRRGEVVLRDGVLEVRAGMFRQRCALADLDLAQARVIDLREHGDWWPLLQDNGISLPGLRLGHFRLLRRRRALFCLLRERGSALLLPARSGRSLLLGLRQPAQALRMLQQG